MSDAAGAAPGWRPGDRRASFDRDEALRRLGAEHFDVLVVGGGITGAGVALDAASRGLRTALVEKGDFASGTSSKSSKLVHGGSATSSSASSASSTRAWPSASACSTTRPTWSPPSPS